MDLLFENNIRVLSAPGKAKRSYVYWDCAELQTQADLYIGAESKQFVINMLITAFDISKAGAVKLLECVARGVSQCEIDDSLVNLIYV